MLNTYQTVFENIYQNNLWNGGSGPGSHADNTLIYRIVLQHILNSHHHIVDLGCGDWQIMSLMHIPDNVTYLGLDVANSVIAENQQKYQRDNVQFKLLNDFSEIPEGDLLIVKDVLQHWPNEMIKSFIETVLPKFKYALITNDAHDSASTSINKDIEIGGYKPLDLSANPFNLKLNVLFEYPTPGFTKKVAWYERDNQQL